MTDKFPLRATFWRVVAGLILLAGVYALYVRVTQGLGAVSNLSDRFPWGLWVGFDVVTGVGLAAGGFTICAVAHIFNIHRYEPLTRPAILTAFLGYVTVIVSLLIDLGKPWNIWHPLIMGNYHSALFEVAMCVMFYTTILFFEFSSSAAAKYRHIKPVGVYHKLVNKLIVPIMIAGVVLSTLHQSSLGSLFLIVPTRMHPLWYSTWLPVWFYISAIAVGFSMVTFEAYMSSRGMDHKLKFSLLSEIMRITGVLLVILFFGKMVEFGIDGKFALLAVPETETYMWWLETIIGVFLPVVLIFSPKAKTSRTWLFIAATLTVFGFLFNRLNVSITSIAKSAGVSYFPSFMEASLTAMLVTLNIIAFVWISKHFDLFGHHAEEGAH